MSTESVYKLTSKGNNAILNIFVIMDIHIQQILVMIDSYINNNCNKMDLICDFTTSIQQLTRELKDMTEIKKIKDIRYKTLIIHKEILANIEEYIELAIIEGYLYEEHESEATSI